MIASRLSPIVALLTVGILGAVDVGLVASAITIAPQATCTVRVHVRQVGPTATWGCVVRFDASRLELIEQRAGDVATFVPDARGLAVMQATGEVRNGGYALADLPGGDGTLAELRFRAIATGRAELTMAPLGSQEPFGCVLQPRNGPQVIPSLVGQPLAIDIVAGGGNAQPPSAPQGLVGTWTGSVVALTWTDTASDETGFVVERSGDGGATWSAIVTLGVNVTGAEDPQVMAGTTYAYRVSAVNAAGASAVAGPVQVLVPVTDAGGGGGGGGGGSGGCGAGAVLALLASLALRLRR
jgi:hypothetical protein